jgi:hypothetical protein
MLDAAAYDGIVSITVVANTNTALALSTCTRSTPCQPMRAATSSMRTLSALTTASLDADDASVKVLHQEHVVIGSLADDFLQRIRSVNHIFNPFARAVNMGRCPATTGVPLWPTPSANAIGQRFLPISDALA